MKQTVTLSIVLMLAFLAQLKAQAPQGINYQAALRNSSGNVLAATNVTLRFSVMQGSSGGTMVYQETHTVSTNAQGLVNVVIGNGTIGSGTFSAITWGVNAYYIKTEVNTGSGFTDMGTQQLVSVPYSLYANSTGTANSLNPSATIDPAQINSSSATNGQVLKWNGTSWAPGNDVGGGSGDNWGTQSILTDATLTGTGIIGNTLKIAQQGAASGQTLKWNGSTWAPASETVDNAGTGVTITSGTINTPWTISGNNIYSNNSGNVGIGTSTPQSKFHLAGASNEIGRVQYGNSSWLGIYNKTRYIGYMGLWNDTNAIDFGSSGTGTGINLVTVATPRLSINSVGNVGIGTTTPAYNLEVKNSNSIVVNAQTTTSNSTAAYRATNNSGASLELIKNSSAVGGTYYGWTANNLALINNSTSGAMMLGSVDSIGFATNGANRMSVRKTGEVMVNGTTYAGSNTGYLYVDYQTYNSIKPAFELNGSNIWMGFKNGNAIKGYIQQNGDNMNVASFSGDLTLYSNGSQRVYVKKAGEVGVHTASPRADFHTDGYGSFRAAGLFTNSSSIASFTSGDSGTLTVYNNYTGSNYAYGITSTTKGTSSYAAYMNSKYCGIRADAAGGTGNAYGGYFTSQNSASTNYGATGYGGGGSTALNYGVYGAASGGSTNYGVYCSGNGVYTGTWASSSDQRLKTNIKPLTSSLDLVMQLKPSSYAFRTDDPRYKSMNLATGLHFGFIAQELEKVIPAVVSNNVHQAPGTEEKVEYKAVNYTELIPILTQAIQEQNALIKALEARIKQLENAK